MAAISPGGGPENRTQFSSPSSCFSKRRSPQSFLITTDGCADFPISPHWRAFQKARCSVRGKASVIMLAREISTPQQKPLWIDTVESSLAKLIKSRSFQALANTPRTQSQALGSINLSRSSKRTLLAFWHAFSIYANQSILAGAGKHFGNVQRVFSQNQIVRLSTPLSSILARLSV